MSTSSLSQPGHDDAALLALRPLIPGIAADVTPVGRFLHSTLRPVLKLQNDLLLQLVADFVVDHHMLLARLSVADQQRQLEQLLARNTKLRYTIIGLVSGLFTSDEYAFYRLNRAEINRRVLELAQQRVLGQSEEVLALTGIIAKQ